ncbi:MAG: glycosyltransferase family 39 protein, partial [Chitinophagaceae bacterium]
NYKPLQILIGLAVFISFSGLFIPLMDPDAGIYASISRTMAEKNDYVNLYFHDMDWLDKPHFPFWVTALFFEIFGFHTWVYKLPGILFTMLGAGYTYLFAKKYYNKTIALWAAFILLTSIHIIVSNNDVRAEPFLTGLIIASIYHFSNSISRKLNIQLVIACLFAACAVMTKGIFTLIPIGGAVAGELLIKKNWKELFHWRWIVAAIFITLFISPELYCLWIQFDQHPEKVVFGSTGVSGVQFFLWDSQFGRFFNTGPIKGKGDYLFYLHTLLWAILPWSLIMYAALFTKLKKGLQKVKTEQPEWFTISGSLLTLLVFSLSAFQLPHYSNIVFPLLAIICAHFIWQITQTDRKVFGTIQYILCVLLLVLAVGLAILYRPPISLLFVILLMVMLGLALLLKLHKKESPYTPYLRSGFVILVVALFLNISFYPALMKYQSGNIAAAYINKNYPEEAIARIGAYIPSGEFYLKEHTYGATLEEVVNGSFKNINLFYLTEQDLNDLKTRNIQFNILQTFDEFHVTQLSLKFLNPKTREKELKKTYLIRIN